MEKSGTVCTLCRRRKVACDRQLPGCGLCLKNRVTCEYSDQKKPPGLRVGIVSQLESRIETLEATVRDIQRSLADGSRNGRSYTAYENASSLTTETPTFEDPVEIDSPMNPSPGEQSVKTSSKSSRPTDSDVLSLKNLRLVCNEWFATYHPWFPILHQPSYHDALQKEPFLLNDIPNLMTFKAIAAVVYQNPQFSIEDASGIQAWSSVTRRKIIKKAMANLSLPSIQALLILSIMDYGAGKLFEFWNVIALCKRMSMNLGLGDIVFRQGANFNQLSTVPPRMLPLPNTFIDREERVRVYWMSEILDSVSTLGCAWNTSLSSPSPGGAMPCSDAVWAFPEHIINIWAFGDFQFSSAFSLYIILAITELWHVHHFLQQSFDFSDQARILHCRTQAQKVDEKLANWRLQFQTAAFRLFNTEHAEEERTEADPFILLTTCLLDCATISLFQRMSHFPFGIEVSWEPWLYATTRCVQACDDMTGQLAELTAPHIGLSNPFLVFNVVVAARFYIVYSRALEASIPQNLLTLQSILKTFGKRWVIAARYEMVIQSAVSEFETPIAMSCMPTQFYDLRYSTLDIHEALYDWAESRTRSRAG